MLCNSTDCILLGALALHPQGKRGWQLDGFRLGLAACEEPPAANEWPIQRSWLALAGCKRPNPA